MKLPIQSSSEQQRFGNHSGEMLFSPGTEGVRPLGGGGGGNPPPGCYPSGTQCRGWIQHMVYCCPGGKTWSREEGWCVGWWDAPPCL